MGPNNNEVQPSIQLPPPVEQAPVSGGHVENAPAGAEIAPAPELLSRSAASAVPSIPTIPLPTTPVIPGVAGQSSGVAAVNQGNPSQASDDDLIEKEWVNKAKQIVEQNRNDPFKQSEELTVFKADYMKKRYNKTIKLSK